VLVVRIELWPRGEASRKVDLAVIAVENVGGTAEAGDYEFAVSHQVRAGSSATLKPSELLRNPRAAWKRGRVRGYDKQYGAVRLLHWVLQAAFPSRKKPWRGNR